MSISAYAIGGKVWLVRTETVAQKDVPTTLPIGSVVLTPDEVKALTDQLYRARAQISVDARMSK